MNWRCRIRRGGVAVAAAAAFSGATAGDARGDHYTNSYCGVLISPGSWCGDGTNHTYDTNEAKYKGSGSVTVCQRLLFADTSVVRDGSSCATGYVYRNYGTTTSTLFEAEVTHIYSGSRHTIYGLARY